MPDKKHSESQMVFSRNLSKHLKRKGKNQRELAKAIGYGPSTVCDWLNGRSMPRMPKLQLIADFLGVSISDLIEDVDEAKGAISEKEQKLLDLFHNIPEEHQDGLLDIVEVYGRNFR